MGTVFKQSAASAGYDVLHSFGADSADGQQPCAGLVEGADGAVYGMTYAGGSNDAGTVFTLATDGSNYRVLHHFGGDAVDGKQPVGRLLRGSDGALYGTTGQGGSNYWGSVFRMKPDGTDYRVLYNFSQDDGAHPAAGLIEGRDGMLYGIASDEFNNDSGLAFRLNRDGTGFMVLHSFGLDGQFGQAPAASLVQGRDGWLYGTTKYGGTNDGTIFKLKTDGSDYAVIYQFTGTLGDGAKPEAELIQGFDGALYGTTTEGGSRQEDGTAFRINTDGTGYRVLHRFTVISSVVFGTSDDGQQPHGLVQAKDGTLYGTTTYGGMSGQGEYQGSGAGTVFELNTNGSHYAVVLSFSESWGDGVNPEAELIQGRDGALYGTTYAGGNHAMGTIYALNRDGSNYRKVFQFGVTPIQGSFPRGPLFQAADGTLYGTTAEGGYGGGSGGGTAFKLKPDGSGFTLLHSFGQLQGDGAAPGGALIQGGDGFSYGTTSDGGYDSDGYGGLGTVFKVNTNGTIYQVIYRFNTNGLDGLVPLAGLQIGRDGALYGTTSGGTITGFDRYYGNVFRLKTDGKGFTVLHTFAPTNGDGVSPAGQLVLGNDGALYGTTKYGGTNDLQSGGEGTIFRLNSDGTGYSILHHFGSSPTDGQHPQAGLVQGNDGAWYGTTGQGGSNQTGMVFKMNTDGTSYVVLYSFAPATLDFQNRQAGLVLGIGGALYGTIVQGGDLGDGSVFRLATAPNQIPFTLTPGPLLPNQSIQLTLNGSASVTYHIEGSIDLSTWVPVTNVFDSEGVVRFIDPGSPNFPRRFYRAVVAP